MAFKPGCNNTIDELELVRKDDHVAHECNLHRPPMPPRNTHFAVNIHYSIRVFLLSGLAVNIHHSTLVFWPRSEHPIGAGPDLQRHQCTRKLPLYCVLLHPANQRERAAGE